MIRAKETCTPARGFHSAWCRLAGILLIAATGACAQATAADAAEGKVGVNKFDLLLQYLGTASGGDGSAAYRKVTQAMGRKSIVDARNAGIPYFRISAMGFAPSVNGARSDLELWRRDRAAYWKIVDQMMADLRDNGLQVIPSFVWNLRQVPAMAGETVTDLIANPSSESSRLLQEYVAEFAQRYRAHPALLFYEIGNEMNLHADLDLVKRCVSTEGRKSCGAWGNYSTEEMIAFTKRIAATIRTIDAKRPISSGHSFPRPSAQHLRRTPEFAPGGADWTKDRMEELVVYIGDTHSGLDLISVHIYAELPLPEKLAADHVELIALASHVATQLRKKLFIGEIGARSDSGLKPRSFIDRALTKTQELRVPYVALWVWQYYQTSTYRSFDVHANHFNIEPGRSDQLLERIAKINGTVFPKGTTDKDRSPPVVILTWPLECARVEPSFRVHAAATDDSGIPPTVELRIGNRRVAMGRRPPYEGSLEGLETGEHEIAVTATDRAGNRASWQSWVLAGDAAKAKDRCVRCCN